jgi:type IV secretory pathway ATPase VirB11/archaellum biosynthesis ATPase
MCILDMQGTRAVMDCATCPLEMFSAKCINSHLKLLSTVEAKIRIMRYEEELIIEFDEEKTKIITEYTSIIRQLEKLMIDPKIYGMKEDEQYPRRKKLLRDFYTNLFMNPLLAERTLKDYEEPFPEKSMFVEGHKTFKAWINGILKPLISSKLYQLTQKTEDLAGSFLSLAGLKSLRFLTGFILTIPSNAKLIDAPGSIYPLGHGVTAKIYSVEGAETNLYVHENPIIENLPEGLRLLLRDAILNGMKESFELADLTTIYETKASEYKQYFLDTAAIQNVDITLEQAEAMGREAASWIVGLGSPIENIALDKENISDAYIDGEDSPIYLEHAKFGLCHTLWRYNKETLEHAFRNVMLAAGGRKFDSKNPVIDVVLTRLNMRCHLQRPPATFGPLQAALRITKETPFTYPQYLNLNSISAFFAGYDDTLVWLGCSEAVLGLKGVGKTAFTSAKISAIGTKKRIIPIQDIEEIPVKAYRKRGFHIGAVRVQPSEREDVTTTELDLVTMANALLRMGDACLIINEIRSRLAIQGVMTLLNTQPGVFLLYNLHAQSLKDVQDRLELVFGMPGASMYATDRYTFLNKARFGRKGRIYRVVGSAYETDQEQRKFVETFTFRRGADIDSSFVACNFIENPEANAWSLAGIHMADIEEKLHMIFVPPALRRRSAETGIPPEQYVLQAFFKGRMYSQILEASKKYDDKELLELDFVVKCNSTISRLLREAETKEGVVDFKTLEPMWDKEFGALLKTDMEERAALRAEAEIGLKEKPSKGGRKP